MSEKTTLVAALEVRLGLVEGLRRRALATWWLRLGAFLLLGAIGLAGLAGAAVGSVWFVGSFLTRSPWALGAGLLAAEVELLERSLRGLELLRRALPD